MLKSLLDFSQTSRPSGERSAVVTRYSICLFVTRKQLLPDSSQTCFCHPNGVLPPPGGAPGVTVTFGFGVPVGVTVAVEGGRGVPVEVGVNVAGRVGV